MSLDTSYNESVVSSGLVGRRPVVLKRHLVFASCRGDPCVFTASSASLCCRAMVRKRWRSLPVPDGWNEVTRGPWPRSVAIPAERERKSDATIRGFFVVVGDDTAGHRRTYQEGGHESSPANPPESRLCHSHYQDQGCQIREALEALGDLSGPEVEWLKDSLRRAREEAH